MPYKECKVYFDGSHYIAIPHTTNPHKKRFKKKEEVIRIPEDETNNSNMSMEKQENTPSYETVIDDDLLFDEELIEVDITEVLSAEDIAELEAKFKPKKGRKVTRKQLFEELYAATIDKKRKERREFIVKAMLPYFNNERDTTQFVDLQLERKYRNLVCRRVRLTRKVRLNNFNYFCTFTYDDKLHTEESFKKKLQGCFKMMCHRKGWKYCGVWERSPTKKRLHFHGLFYIPEGQMPGELIVVKDYSPVKKCVQTTLQNTYFNERFGRTDFSALDDELLGASIQYLIKYIEKTGEKIVYSKGLPQYFISDIMDDDVICTIGQEDKKLLLFDDFTCWDEGEYIGTVSPETIEKMRKSN